MAYTYQDALQKMQVLNQFMDQITPQLQQLGVDRSGYKGYAQAYQSAVNNNLEVPQDFADIMYEVGGFGNTGKQLFEPSKDGNPRLTEAGKAYASRNLPEGVALHQGFFDFGNQVSDLAKSKGDNTRYKNLPQQITAAAGYGMEIPQHIQDLAYAVGLGGTPNAQALYKQGFSGGQKLFTPREGKAQGIYTDAGRAYASQNLPEGKSLSDAFFDYDKGSYDFLTKQGVTDIPRNIPERAKMAEAAGYQTPQYINDMLYAAGIDRAEASNNAAPAPAPVAKTQNATNTQQINNPANIPGAPGNLSGLQTVPTNLSFIKPQPLTPNSVPYAPSVAATNPVQLEVNSQTPLSRLSSNAAPSSLAAAPATPLESAVKDIRDIAQSENKYDIGNFDKLLNRLEELENNTSSDAGQKKAAPTSAKYAAKEGAANEGSSNAPEFLASFKKRLEEEADSDTPAVKGRSYAEITGDTSTKGGRDRSSKGNGTSRPSRRPRRGGGLFGVRPFEMSPKYRASMDRAEAKFEARRRDARRARDRGLADYRSRRSSSRGGTEFGPGRARRDVSGSF